MKNILELIDITKKYPGVRALDKVSMSVAQGEVHALIGENGAGKSTLIKAVAGVIDIDAGSFIIDGKEYTQLDPQAAIKAGIAVIYQEFSLVLNMSVAENVFLGEKIGGKYLPNFKEMYQRTKDIFSKFNIDIDPKQMVGTLTTGQMQMVEIAKAISKNARILIMDEPSASLSIAEVEAMFSIVRQLKKSGVTIIYISHRLEELFEIGDRVTVLRDGQFVKTMNIKEIDRQKLVNLMVGRELIENHPQRHGVHNEEVLAVKSLTGNGVKDISFSLYKGEILGLGGLVGAGRTELAKLIYGAAKKDSGELYIKGKCLNITSPEQAIKSGIGLIPEDRKLEGAILEYAIDWNISLMSLKRLSKKGVINRKAIDILCDKYFDELKIKAVGKKQLVKNLSGGNQQKVVLAKVLAAETEIIIFDEPTRGIDVGAKQEIYNLMNELTDCGISIIMISSDMEELLGMSDRIIVMHEGELAGEVTKNQFSQERILELASGL